MELDQKPYVDNQKRRVISFVGGGGKTTTMYALADIFRKNGKKVVVTTSTHLQAPSEEIRARNLKEIRRLWESGKIAVIGNDCEIKKNLVEEVDVSKSVRKMCMPSPDFLQEVLREADVILIEADGAKHLPCKVPKKKEPVIISECTDVIAVMGMDALGERLEKVCFRKELAIQFLNVDVTHRMTPEDLAQILLSDQGSRKSVGLRNYFIVLNKCDNEKIREQADRICSLLKVQGVKKVMLTSDANREEELKKYFS